MIGLSVLIGIISAICGYWLAHILDASIAGSMATVTGLIFGMAFLLAPNRGMIAIAHRRIRQKWEFAQTMLAVHLYQHEDLPEASPENRLEHCHQHLKWEQTFAERVVQQASQKGIILKENGFLRLTDSGREIARKAIVS